MTADRNRRIVELHRAGETLQTIGERYGISGERVRQIVRQADGGGARRSGATRRANGAKGALRPSGARRATRGHTEAQKADSLRMRRTRPAR
ncbi:MAG: sigma factor-like helix-turn-helix DNA-binding protein [Acidimicrobiales bacterium]